MVRMPLALRASARLGPIPAIAAMGVFGPIFWSCAAPSPIENYLSRKFVNRQNRGSLFACTPVMCYLMGNVGVVTTVTLRVMDVEIADRKLKRALEDNRECTRRYGAEMAQKIRLRMTALHAADSLADFWPPLKGPERCHELKGDLKGTFSIDLKHPYRLLFRAVEPEKQSSSENEKDRWSTIKTITILDIEDTHG